MRCYNAIHMYINVGFIVFLCVIAKTLCLCVRGSHCTLLRGTWKNKTLVVLILVNSQQWWWRSRRKCWGEDVWETWSTNWEGGRGHPGQVSQKPRPDFQNSSVLGREVFWGDHKKDITPIISRYNFLFLMIQRKLKSIMVTWYNFCWLTDEYFTCQSKCLACQTRCSKAINHDGDHTANVGATCIYQKSLDNKHLYCLRCYQVP